MQAATPGRRFEPVAAASEGSADSVPTHVRHGARISFRQAALDFLVLLNPCDALAFNVEVGACARCGSEGGVRGGEFCVRAEIVTDALAAQQPTLLPPQQEATQLVWSSSELRAKRD